MGLGHIKTFLDSSIEWPSATTRYTAICLAYYADQKGIIRISQTELAGEMRLSAKTLARTLDGLCDMGVYVRLGHGRYGVHFGPTTDSSEEGNVVPNPKGADREFDRLKAIKQSDQAIYYGKDGWPVLGTRPVRQ